MNTEEPDMPVLWVNGIVAIRDNMPYIQLSNEKGVFAQMTMAEARSFAMDILQMAARTEADAIIHKFCSANEFPGEAATTIMAAFREFRAGLDEQLVERKIERISEGGPDAQP